ncbi:Retrovirus-related Pol polyprotein from type-1 retrotransposable element R1 [Eumeta japonica]|uniref:Retrovirus-related Pol polyprotein from type-1 retrotransposable element R1 n=1 Tax=Eumeta variegata TaxID=151549 RepID=A0A4C1WSG4_EUMVA|nr:Retrovirus-related Pol polyprotein from type-1 retrotransposable element R1 [Eumeta japonica]
MAEMDNSNPWRLAYREAAGHVRAPGNTVSCFKVSQKNADDVDSVIELMLDVLLLQDDHSLDSEYHELIRYMMLVAPSGKPVPPMSGGCLGGIICRLPITSSGFDGIGARIVKEAWKTAAVKMTTMYGKCVVKYVFPDIWKMGRLVILPKGSDRTATDPGAYRPLTLLPLLGKILERVLLIRLELVLRKQSDCLHGFTRGRSTVTALNDILGAVGHSANHYNGIPRGSVVGPALWNMLLDDLFRLPVPAGCRLKAYADDVTAEVEGNSRPEIKTRGKELLEVVAA